LRNVQGRFDVRLIADTVILANLTTVGVIAKKTNSKGETHMVSE